MPIYKYTLKKYLKSYSTWIILIISLVLVVVIGGVVPFSVLKKNASAIEYAKLSIAIVSGMTSFLAIFTTIFAGFKSANMFKDEIEDGTFLIMVSKPISRRAIILYKWLSLQTVIIMYTFLVSITFGISLYAFDVGSSIKGVSSFYGLKVLKNQAFMISTFIWMILFVMSLIFSSIAILLSTKLSVGATIGISIALGVVIPVTSLIAVFTRKEEYSSLTHDWKRKTRAFAESSDFKDNIKKLPGMTEAAAKAFFDKYFKDADNYTKEATSLYRLGIKTNKNDLFKKLWFFDISYQINTLAEFATDLVITEEAKTAMRESGSTERAPGLTNFKMVSDKEGVIVSKEQFEQTIVDLWKINKPLVTGYLRILLHLLSSPDNQQKINDNKTNLLSTRINNYLKGEKQINQKVVKKLNDDLTLFIDNYDDITTSTKWDEDKLFNFYKITEYLKTALYDNVPRESAIRGFLGKYYETLMPLGMIHNNATNTTDFIINKQKILPVTPGFQTKTALLLIKQGLSLSDFNFLSSAIDQKQTISKVSFSSYTNKYDILYSYIGIAFGLLPLSYFMVRRQDFK